MRKNVTRKKGGKGGMIVVDYVSHRLNMELDLQVYLGSMCTAVLIVWDPATSPPHLGSYTRALLVSQDRRNLYVTLDVSQLFIENMWNMWNMGEFCFKKQRSVCRSVLKIPNIETSATKTKNVFIYCKERTQLRARRTVSKSVFFQTT
jgi:hypothetical protein